MFGLLFLMLLGFIGVSIVFAVRGSRSAVRNVKNRSPLPAGYRRAQRMRMARWVGAAAIVAVIGALWAWFLRDPIPAEPGWF